MSISIRFPFQDSFEGGMFRSTKTTAETVRSNLIALLTLKKRQRPMDINLYSPLYDYIMEPWDEISSSELKSALILKIQTYIPEINVQDIVFSFDEGTLVLTTKIVYEIPDLGDMQDEIVIDLQTEQID
jgi:hypothetical protein